jgi:hypothetical protein
MFFVMSGKNLVFWGSAGPVKRKPFNRPKRSPNPEIPLLFETQISTVLLNTTKNFWQHHPVVTVTNLSD